jgi:hypothetical protein
MNGTPWIGAVTLAANVAARSLRRAGRAVTSPPEAAGSLVDATRPADPVQWPDGPSMAVLGFDMDAEAVALTAQPSAPPACRSCPTRPTAR